jgi:hypothetical protein
MKKMKTIPKSHEQELVCQCIFCGARAELKGR